jgi:hypothetical protein
MAGTAQLQHWRSGLNCTTVPAAKVINNQIIHILNNLCVGVGVSGATAATAQ